MSDYTGNDNYGRPKSEYLEKISKMSDEQLKEECGSKIYMSAFCNNNPRADWHWMVDACYDECEKRGKLEIYKLAHKEIVDEYS